MRNGANLGALGRLILIGLSAFCRNIAAQAPADGLSDRSAVSRSAIHATRLDYSEFETPEAVTVITQEDIRLAGYLEVSEIFRAVPGFRLVKIGDESRLSYHGTAAVQTRRMLITVDGRSVLVGNSQHVEFDKLPLALEDIARVTIVRGPNGAAYGDNAFLASIDFETIGRDDPHGVAVRAGGGYNGRSKAGLSVNEHLGSYEFQLLAGAERDGGYDYFDDATKTPRDDGKEIRRARMTVEREFAERSRWRLDTSIYDNDNKTGVRALRLTGEQDNKGRFVALSNRRELGESSRFDWFASYNNQEEAIRHFGCYTAEAIASTSSFIADPEDLAGILAPMLFVPALLGTSLENTCFYTDIGIASERSELEGQFESRHGPWRNVFGGSMTNVDASSTQYFAGRDQRQRSYRLFGETALSSGEWHASLGVMAQDSDNVDDIELAWRGAVNWQFRSNQALRYSYARSIRIPSLVETETFWTGAFLFGRRDEPLSSYSISLPLPLVTNDTRIKPETVDAHALGYFGTFLRSSATVDIKLFHEKIRDPVEASVFYFTAPPLNTGAYTLSGIEGEFSVRLSERWKLSGHYSYLDTDAPTAFERGLHGNSAGSLSTTYRLGGRHAFTASYYGNSTISGNSYDRYDLVYNYSREFGPRLFRSQLIFNRHIGGVDGLDDPVSVLANEGRFAHLNQFFLILELTF